MNTLIVALVLSSLAYANAKPTGYLNGHELENDLVYSSSIGLIDDHVEHVPVIAGAIESTSSVVHTELKQTHPSPAIVAHHEVVLGHGDDIINHDGIWNNDDSWESDNSWEHDGDDDNDDDDEDVHHGAFVLDSDEDGDSSEEHGTVLLHETPIAETHDTVVSTHLEQTHPSPVLVHDDLHVAEIHAPVVAEVHTPILTEVHAPILTEVHAPIVTEVHAPIVTEVHAPILTEVHIPIVAEVHAPIAEEKVISTIIEQTHVSPLVVEHHHDAILAAPTAIIIDDHHHHDSLLFSHH